jgi:glycosyltransferase involved in cell wall biosynthesis
MPKMIPTVTLSDSEPTGFFASAQIAKRFNCEIRKRKIQTVFVPSFSPLPNLLCLFAAKLARCRIVLMTESWDGTGSRNRLARWVKRFLVCLCDSALVGGTPQTEYLKGLGMDRKQIFSGYDVVDTNHFAEKSAAFSGSPLESRRLVDPPLPRRFFLSLGRFVAKKNLTTLVKAYALAKSEMPAMETRLVMVGEGLEEPVLKAEASRLGLSINSSERDNSDCQEADVSFYPFQQHDITPLFFSLCEAFVLPSSWEEWGLVVNEAMACGAPVIVSTRVGAGFDLVKDGMNGFLFEPDNVDALKDHLLWFVSNPEGRLTMGQAARDLIQLWGPEKFGEGALAAWKAANNK